VLYSIPNLSPLLPATSKPLSFINCCCGPPRQYVDLQNSVVDFDIGVMGCGYTPRAALARLPE